MKCELQEHCSLYLLGMLEQNERTMYEQHILQGCEECTKELSLLGETIELLAQEDTSLIPSPGIKNLLMQKIQERKHQQSDVQSPQVWKEWKPVNLPKGLHTIRSGEGAWENTGIEGISVKKLFADPDQQTITMLIKMAAGTAYPGHRHAGVEECYVLEGDLHVGEEIVLHAGDYQRAGVESIHRKQWTDKGCLLFIVSSTEDQLLE